MTETHLRADHLLQLAQLTLATRLFEFAVAGTMDFRLPAVQHVARRQKFWLAVLTELKNRGVKDLLIRLSVALDSTLLLSQILGSSSLIELRNSG
jgi:hypothetical protein